MTPAAIERVREIERHMLATQPQFDLQMQHVLHAGMYARTCRLPAGIVITGALIKIPTLVIISGNAFVWLGEKGRQVKGYAVLTASAGRKQAFRAITDTVITMLFPTEAKTVAEAEREFTDEWDRLAPGRAETIITGESPTKGSGGRPDFRPQMAGLCEKSEHSTASARPDFCAPPGGLSEGEHA